MPNKIEKLAQLPPKLWFTLNHLNRFHQQENFVEEDKSLQAAIQWLCVAQDAKGTGGVSAMYDMLSKTWKTEYRETTGYIIETFIDYAGFSGNIDYLNRAIAMGDWLITQQDLYGGFGEPTATGTTLNVFNTGQIMLGLIRLYKSTNDEKYLISALKSGDWLCRVQDAEGTWTLHTTQGPKTYHARVDWPLLQLFEITGDQQYYTAAIKNLDWILAQQNSVGWFANASLWKPNAPITHLIVYTIRGLLECSFILGQDHAGLLYFDAAKKAADALLKFYRKFNADSPDKLLPISFDSNWNPVHTYSCLTGNFQLAIVWFRLYESTHYSVYKHAAQDILFQTMQYQIASDKPELNGGFTGSYPFYERYCGFAIPNWGVKFFADAVLLDKKLS